VIPVPWKESEFKILIEVPYSQKSFAKSLNCKWCSDEKCWYTTNPNSIALNYFAIIDVLEIIRVDNRDQYEVMTGLKRGFKL
jgi:hypothetical protein